MRKTLLLVFIHGFKGGDDTFGNFPVHLRTLASHALPAVNVVSEVYPKYDTQGELKDSVWRFREWLQNKVIDLEVANQSSSPTVDPSVHVFLIGHSMGGIVGAETILLLSSEQPISSVKSCPGDPDVVEPTSFMFPHIQGLLAFDTPFLGISPGVVSYGAEGHLKTASTAYSTLSEVAGLFGYGGASTSPKAGASSTSRSAPKLLPPPPSPHGDASSVDAAATPSWQRWGRYAMFAGAAGAVAAGGAAALYSQRQRLSAGLSWASSHLEFVGCLARPAELRQRLSLMSEVDRDRGTVFVNFYACLGKGAPSLVGSTADTASSTHGKGSFNQKIIRARHRTFCFLPPEVDYREGSGGRHVLQEPGLRWTKTVNDKAPDEIRAHMYMFQPNENPDFYALTRDACSILTKYIDKGWYSTATMPRNHKHETQSTTHPTRALEASRFTDADVDAEGDDLVVL